MFESMKYKIISVESRKGGVGKTTAALNLSNLLVERGYKVLLLDIDITGTSIEGSYNSAFWRGKINPIKQGDKEINLLKIFHDIFLKGEGLPNFYLKNNDNDNFKVSNDNFVIVDNKINIFNSEIYNNNDSSLICDPRILFDELHSFWLIEMIESLCNSFAECVNDIDKTIVVLDNSPGYVGLGKAIHDWLTDIGPEYGKFLTISSLDVQDLNSCLSAIHAIENIVNQKLEGAKYYNQLKRHDENINEQLSEESKKLFLKLATDEERNGRYSYYKTAELKKEELNNYQALIINKAPLEIKSDSLYYDVSKSLKGDYKKRETLQLFSGEQKDRKPQNVVYFDNYIHFQFIEPFVEKVKSYGYDKERGYSSLKGYFTKIENEIIENQNTEIEYRYSRLLNIIDGYENTLSKLLGRLQEKGFDNIVRLIEEEWHPKTPFLKTQQVFESLCDNIPFFEKYHLRKDEEYENNLHEEDFRHEFESFFMEFEHAYNRNFDIFYEKTRTKFSLETLCYFLMKPYMKDFRGNESTFLISIIAIVISIQNERLRKNENLLHRKKNNGFQYFLANENVTFSEVRKYLHLIEGFPHKYMKNEFRHEKLFYIFEKSNILPNFYNSFCHTQARLIDIHDDFSFLIQVLRSVTIDDKNERNAVFPNIRDILNEVVVKKTTPSSYAVKKLHNEFQSAKYMSDFSEVLNNNVISKWNL